MNSSRLPTPPPSIVHAPYIPPPAPSLAGGEGSPYSTVRRLLLPARTRKALNRRAGRRGQLTSPSNQTWSSSNRAPGPLHRRRTPALGRPELARAWISLASVDPRRRRSPPGDEPPMARLQLCGRRLCARPEIRRPWPTRCSSSDGRPPSLYAPGPTSGSPAVA
jgi:hypothetical protein